MKKKTLSIPKIVISCISAVVLLVLAFDSYVTIDSGTVGVVKTLGAVQENPLKEGAHFKIPFFQRVVRYDIKMRKASARAASSSRDLQIVQAVIDIQYSVNSSMTPKVVQKFGPGDALENTVLTPAVQETVKAVTARYSAEELVTKRSEVKTKIDMELRKFAAKTLRNKGIEGAIDLANIAITDFDFSKQFNDAIEAKVQAEQNALRAENEKKQRITNAEAKAAEQKLAADAAAFQIETESKARADAIERESKALKANPELIELRRVEKWDGKLPKFTGGVVPFMDVK